MKVPHLVYLLGSAPTARDVGRFGLAYFRDQGFRVSVFDVAEICHPRIKPSRDPNFSISGVELKVVSTLEELAELGGVLRTASVIMCFATEGLVKPENTKLLRLVAHSGRPYVLLRSEAHPAPLHEQGKIPLPTRLAQTIKRLRYVKPTHSVARRLPLKFNGLRPADYVILGGRRSLATSGLITGHTQPIYGHSQDYDQALKIGITPDQITNSAVFLDQYLPHHRDWQVLKSFPGFDADLYYRRVNRLFARIDKELGLKVIIAAHPRADYEKQNPFEGREIVFGRPAELVRACKLAITVSSLALNFAVIYDKPLMLISFAEHFSIPEMNPLFRAFSHELGVPYLFLENVETVDLSAYLKRDASLYQDYRANYLVDHQADGLSLWQRVHLGLSEHGLLPAPQSGQPNQDNIKHG